MGVYGMVKVGTRTAWLKQANEANEKLQESGCKNLNEFAERCPEDCQRLLQAMDALGCNVDPDLARKCGIRHYLTEDEMERMT